MYISKIMQRIHKYIYEIRKILKIIIFKYVLIYYEKLDAMKVHNNCLCYLDSTKGVYFLTVFACLYKVLVVFKHTMKCLITIKQPFSASCSV